MGKGNAGIKPFIGITSDISDAEYHVKSAYSQAFSHSGFTTCIIPVGEDVDMLTERLDGIVISGGDDIHPSYYNEEPICKMKLIDKKRTDFEMVLFRKCVKGEKPVLGICNGMQLMNVACGGTLYQDIELQVSIEINHRKGYHNIVVTDDTVMSKGNYMVSSGHHQAIKKRGKDIRPFAVSEDGIIEAIGIDGHTFAVGVQWHPERDPDNIVNKKLFQCFREACCAR